MKLPTSLEEYRLAMLGHFDQAQQDLELGLSDGAQISAQHAGRVLRTATGKMRYDLFTIARDRVALIGRVSHRFFISEHSRVWAWNPVEDYHDLLQYVLPALRE